MKIYEVTWLQRTSRQIMAKDAMSAAVLARNWMKDPSPQPGGDVLLSVEERRGEGMVVDLAGNALLAGPGQGLSP